MANEIKKIAIFGAYFNHNFGDDLQGFLIANKISTLGYHPVLWRGPNYKIENKKFEIADNLNSFLDSASFLIIGGGMLFCNSNYHELWNDLDLIIEGCEKNNIPMMAISVGSDGDFKNINNVSQRFLESRQLKAISLRLKDDFDELKKLSLCNDIEFYPDIVLTSSKLIQRSKISNILICISLNKIEWFFISVFLFKLFPNLNFFTLSQFSEESSLSRLYVQIKNNHLKNNGVDDVLNILRKSDLIIGKGLHIGMSGLASGANFISMYGTGKSISFLKSIGHDKYIIYPNKNPIKRIINWLKILKILKKPLMINNNLIDIQSNAHNHYNFLKDRLDKYMSKSKF